MARKEKIYHYIYKTTNLLNGKYYYGMHSTDNLEDGYLGSGKRLRYSVNKHGAENHKAEILEFLPDRKSLAKRENEIINLNEIAKEDCMNLVIGGQGGYISKNGVKLGWEKMDKVLSEKYGSNYPSIVSKIYCDSLTNEEKHLRAKKIKEGQINANFDYGKSFRGKKHRPESIDLMRKSHSINNGAGENNSQFGTCWITNGIENKKIKKDDQLPENWKYGRKK